MENNNVFDVELNKHVVKKFENNVSKIFKFCMELSFKYYLNNAVQEKIIYGAKSNRKNMKMK